MPTASPAARIETDVVVVGSGVGGLCAATCAALAGLRVIVVEKAGVFGGCTAFSGGMPWIPGNHHMQRAGIEDSPALAMEYLRHTVGHTLRQDMVSAYLETAPRMLAFMEERTAVKFQLRPEMPDYEDVPGTTYGRCLDVVPYDGDELGPWFRMLRPPRPEMTLFGGMMVNAADVRHLLAAKRSIDSAQASLRLLLRYGRDWLRHRRGSRLVGGNALAARLLRSAVDAGVDLWAHSPAQELLKANGKVVGVRVSRDGADTEIRARCGTVVATGGFPQGKLREQFIPYASQHRSMAPAENSGDGIALALRAGAVMDEATPANAFFVPVSVMKRADGADLVFPHLISDRAKPGVIAVDQHGRRFTNEAANYHQFVLAMQGPRTQPAPTAIPAFLVCDAAFLRRFGLGLVRPAPFPRKKFIRNGYLVRGDTLEDLARQLRVDARQLRATVEAYNAGARTGTDPAFGRGTTRYNRYMGDPTHPVSTNNAPIVQGPFYAVRLQTGDIGTSLGIRADSHARALDATGQPIDGLYVCGNDMTSMMVGTYATGGITIGPALTFGFRAANHIQQRSAGDIAQPSEAREPELSIG